MASLMNEPDTDFHLKLNEQLFHIPHELVRRNIKQVHKLIDKESVVLQDLFAEMSEFLASNTLEEDKLALDKLNDIIKHVDVLEKKLTRRCDEELKLLERIDSRIRFFRELENSKLQKDVPRLIEWYQKYTNLLIGDYLIRNSHIHSLSLGRGISEEEDDKYSNPGVVFLKQQQLQTLLDYDILLAANRISKALTEHHDLGPLIMWINENRSFLKKNRSFLEFEARLQEYVELIKASDFIRAIACFRIFLLKFMESNFADLKLASGLLIFIKSCQHYKLTDKSAMSKSEDVPPSQEISGTSEVSLQTKSELYEHFFRKSIPSKPTIPQTSKSHFTLQLLSKNVGFERYTELLDEKRWTTLNDLFTKEYYSMYGISHQEPLLMYLSLGISALKTKECFIDKAIVPSDSKVLDNFINDNVLKSDCPVCDEDFAPVAKTLPYAHHTQSKLFENPVMLPNGNIYDAKKLKLLAATLGRQNLCSLGDGQVMDPIDKSIYSESEFITMYPT